MNEGAYIPVLEVLASQIPDDGRCCHGVFQGKRCRRQAYYRTHKDGQPLPFIWCAKHKPQVTDARTTVEHEAMN